MNPKETNTLQSWATGKLSMFTIGLMAGYALYNFGVLQKLTGLFLHRDVDYLTLLGDIQEQSSEETSDKEYLAEEIAVYYCQMVMKSLISDLSDYSGYDPSLFSDLTSDEY